MVDGIWMHLCVNCGVSFVSEDEDEMYCSKSCEKDDLEW